MQLTKALQKGQILVSDGAWGTFLHQKGLQPGECPELWNLTHREEVLDIARSYVEAGADLIETNSFGANRIKLKHYGLENRAREINRTAAEISREAAGEDRIVLGSMGPTGKFLITGEVTEEALLEAFSEQAVALEAGGVDAVCIETMSALDEALIAVKAVREYTDLEIVCTFTFERMVDGTYRTMMGVSPAEMAKALVQAGVDVIGTNCGNGMGPMIEIVREIRSVTQDIPILVHANAGKPIVQEGKTVFPETPEEMASQIPELIRAGANVIGGCCGTTPEHIRAMREVVDKHILNLLFNS